MREEDFTQTSSRRVPKFVPGDVSLDQTEPNYLLQTTGAFRQAPGGGGPMSRCQTLPSSN